MKSAEGFWSRVDRRSADECWPWLGTTNHRGTWSYGVLEWDDEPKGPAHRPARTTAHRVAYELANGPVPEGLVLDHLCRNRLCCNPDHLEAVTNRVNILRGVGATAQAARRTVCLRGHAYQERTKRDGTTDRHCYECALARCHKWRDKVRVLRRAS